MRDGPLFSAKAGRPMRTVFFASGGPANIETALELAKTFPERLRIDLVVTDRPNIPAIEVADRYGVPTVVGNFPARSRGVNVDQDSIIYRKVRCDFHDWLLERIEAFEHAQDMRFDFAVFAYRLLIQGRLLARFAGRAINQHPADLSLLDAQNRRRYVGISGHRRQIEDGHAYSRTSTILINEDADAGEILVQGPRLAYVGSHLDRERIRSHEIEQKAASDRPALRFALAAIAAGRFAVSGHSRHPDGTGIVLFSGRPLDYQGVQLNTRCQSENAALRRLLDCDDATTEVF